MRTKAAVLLLTAGISIAATPATRFSPAALAPQGTPIDWTRVAAALGAAGAMQPGEVYKVGMPRGDLHVSVGGVAIRPALALGSWAGFHQTGEGTAMAMGDLVLLDAEVGPVVAKLQAGGVEVTAIHNHLLNETPHITYVHFHAGGDPLRIAETLHAAVSLTGTPLGRTAAPAGAKSFALDTAQVSQLLGRSGKLNGGVYQVGVPRAAPVTEDGVELPPAMGVATALNFQPTGGGHAAITGDFVLTATEVNPVITALRSGGITVTALHSHLLDESPRLFFMHFWANDDALKLAKGLRAALDLMAVKPPG